MTNYPSLLRQHAAALLICISLIGADAAAQSGRRAKPAPPVPVPTPEPSPTPKPAEKSKPEFNFIVAIDKNGDFGRISLNAYSGVLQNCVDRLNDAPAVRAEEATRDLSRGEAVHRAESEKEVYIVWLQLRSDSFSSQSNDTSANAYIQYAVFAPLTGKQVTSGNTYPDAYRNQRIRLPTSNTNGDYYLNQAARGAAERILDHFHQHLPNTQP